MKRLLILLIAISVGTMVNAQSSFQNDVIAMLTANSGKVISLAEAIPEENYSWSPSEGVRNVKDVALHIAGANYFFPTFMGVNPPEGVDPRSFEATIKDKETTISTLKSSYEHLMKAIQEIPDEKLEEKIDFFGTEMSMRALLLASFGHCEEHMGQLIAYARSNKVAPPWSR